VSGIRTHGPVFPTTTVPVKKYNFLDITVSFYITCSCRDFSLFYLL